MDSSSFPHRDSQRGIIKKQIDSWESGFPIIPFPTSSVKRFIVQPSIILSINENIPCGRTPQSLLVRHTAETIHKISSVQIGKENQTFKIKIVQYNKRKQNIQCFGGDWEEGESGYCSALWQERICIADWNALNVSFAIRPKERWVKVFVYLLCTRHWQMLNELDERQQCISSLVMLWWDSVGTWGCWAGCASPLTPGSWRWRATWEWRKTWGLVWRKGWRPLQNRKWPGPATQTAGADPWS